jgi:hypothetical protein
MHLRLIQEVDQYKMIVFSIVDYMKREGIAEMLTYVLIPNPS